MLGMLSMISDNDALWVEAKARHSILFIIMYLPSKEVCPRVLVSHE